MKTPTRRSSGLLAVGVALLVLGGTGKGFAFWTGPPGTAGSGAAGTGTAEPLVLAPATPTADLRPGGQTAVRLSVTNPNPATLRVGSLVLDGTRGSGGLAVDSAHSGCALSALSFTTQTNGGSGWTFAGNDSTSVTLANALSMSTDAANACQGAAFTVHLMTGP